MEITILLTVDGIPTNSLSKRIRMILSASVSTQIIAAAREYLDRSFDYENFNCVHFVRAVYLSVGITLPLLDRAGHPPSDFHLSEKEFALMPLGHSAFFRRKTSTAGRIWTHVAIISSSTELIHCPRRFGGKVTVTPLEEFLEVYALAPKSAA